MKDRIVTFCKRETVFVAAAVAAALSSFLIYPSAEYFSYPDYRVLALLFCLMMIVAGIALIAGNVWKKEKVKKDESN